MIIFDDDDDTVVAKLGGCLSILDARLNPRKGLQAGRSRVILKIGKSNVRV
jgi:hypothetical protein